jgi:biofilm PGA synthesis lipoprotein PgaB
VAASCLSHFKTRQDWKGFNVLRLRKKGVYLLVATLAVSVILFWHLGYIGLRDPLRESAEASVSREAFSPETGLQTPPEKQPETSIERGLRISPQKKGAPFTRRMLAAQVLAFGCNDYREVEDSVKRLSRVGVNTLIVRAFQNRGDRVYGFARPRCREGVYFETEHAPVVDPLLPRLVSIGHRYGLKVFAWMETRKMPLRLPDPEGSKAMEYCFEKRALTPAGMWSIFDQTVEQRIVALYGDVVRSGIDGILIQDDLIMYHSEDFSPKAVALFEEETGKVLQPGTLYQGPFKDPNGRWYVSEYTDTFWEWSRWKNQKLLKIAHKLIQASRAANPQVEFAMNFMYESVTDPRNALAWLSQSLAESTKLPIDFYAIMAYHRQIKNELNLTDAGTYEKISNMTANILKLIDDPNKIVMKVQLEDWNTGKEIPAVEADEVFRRINAEARVSLAFIPYSAKVPLGVIRNHFQ